MRSTHKPKKTPPNKLKAAVILRYGTIANYIRKSGQKKGTVYAALKNRRMGKISEAIRKEVQS